MQLDVPPRWIMIAAKKTMKETNRWSDCYDVLAAYYGVRKVTARVDPERVSDSAIACYVKHGPGEEPMIYTKESQVSSNVAFHEFGHHLQATLLKGRLSKMANEHFADSYAEAMEAVWNSIQA